MAIDGIVNVPDGGENGPEAVDLGIIPVDLRSDEEYWRDCKSECQGGQERIRIQIDLFEGCRIGHAVKDHLWHRTQLIQIWRDGAEVVGAFCQSPDHRKCHF